MEFSKLKDLLHRIYKEYPRIILFFGNILLAILLLIAKDPWDWFKKTYQNSESFYKTKSEEIQTIISGRKGQESILNRNLDGWTVQLPSGLVLPGDSARIEELIQACLHLRKFTLLSESNSVSKEEFGLGGDEPILELKSVSGNSIGKILIGAPVRKGSGTYILDEKNQIWLVKENLKSVTGGGKLDFFLSRSLIPPFPSREKVSKIAISGLSSIDFNLSKQGENWTLETSGSQILASSEEVENYLEEIKKLSADEVLLEKSEEYSPVPKDRNFKIEIVTSTDRYLVSPIGMTKLGSYVFQREGLSYRLVLDPWNLERILQKDLADFSTRFLSP
ncbi:DUF4340 domain-containing protein [Leptospira dzoumogneensis]|uniref:DUF4340 domain-containing protein n=1 Tax=Leptospira dzoumogneensis TaxID=2484904 RepID=A0A4Z1ADZ4_9LEPT|nr:DUF4340 domain-containing protein [Leptospira dzoumogneensis]TGN02004.1 DUF4340 domain-containing protein [Leptospira dzoumogneensis]